MHRIPNKARFNIGDGLAQFEFALRQTSLIYNTKQINITNLSKVNNEIRIPKKGQKQVNKKSSNYDPQLSNNNYYNDYLDSTKKDITEIDFSNNDNIINFLDQKIEPQFEIHPPSSPYHYSPITAKSKKSKTHNLSKYEQQYNNEYHNNMRKTTNIRRKKINEDTIPSPSLSSFRAPEQLRKLMLAFTQLEYFIRNFLKNNQYYIQFAKKWKYFSDSFDRFIETASLHFSSNFNYNTSSSSIYRQITKTTPVYLTSEIIVNNFSEFIQESNEIESTSSQFICSIQDEFEQIHKLIKKARNSMAQNRYRTDIPSIKFEEFQNNVIALNEELFPKNFLNTHSNFNFNLNRKRLHLQICELNKEVFEIFHKHLKYSFMNLATKIQLRTDLSSCLSNIEESLLLAEKIGTFVKNMRDYIELTNKELTVVLNLIGFPYVVDLGDADRKSGKESTISKSSKKSRDSVEIANKVHFLNDADENSNRPIENTNGNLANNEEEDRNSNRSQNSVKSDNLGNSIKNNEFIENYEEERNSNRSQNSVKSDKLANLAENKDEIDYIENCEEEDRNSNRSQNSMKSDKLENSIENNEFIENCEEEDRNSNRSQNSMKSDKLENSIENNEFIENCEEEDRNSNRSQNSLKSDELENSIESKDCVDYIEEEERNSKKFNESTDFVSNADGITNDSYRLEDASEVTLPASRIANLAQHANVSNVRFRARKSVVSESAASSSNGGSANGGGSEQSDEFLFESRTSDNFSSNNESRNYIRNDEEEEK